MNRLIERLSHELNNRVEQQAFRSLKTFDGAIDFCSNDYLGLAQNLDLKNKIKDTLSSLPNEKLGSGGSRLLAGNSSLFERTETFLASHFLSEASLLFNSGYNANLGFFSAIPGRRDTVLYDEKIHACIKDGIRLSQAKGFSFKHNDLSSLRVKLEKTDGDCIVVVESIYSMDGDSAPLAELADMCDEFEALLVVDEAHSTGVFGKEGEGLVCELGLENRVFARIHTFGKGPGVHGGAVMSSLVVKNYLINNARQFIYTTALPDHAVVAIKESVVINKAKEYRESLWANVRLYKALISPYVTVNDSPVQVVIVPGNERIRAFANDLQKNNFDVRPILSPTVEKGEERVRICLHAFNTQEEIETLCKILIEEIK